MDADAVRGLFILLGLVLGFIWAVMTLGVATACGIFGIFLIIIATLG
jgi:hypothetical protein